MVVERLQQCYSSNTTGSVRPPVVQAANKLNFVDNTYRSEPPLPPLRLESDAGSTVNMTITETYS